MPENQTRASQNRIVYTPLAIGLAFASVFSASASAWELIDLGEDVTPTDINGTGSVVGTCRVNRAGTAAFHYDIYNGTVEIIASAVSANGVNDSGQITGNTTDGAFLYHSGRLNRWPEFSGNALNEAGFIAGSKAMTNPYRPAPEPLAPALYTGYEWLTMDIARVYSRGRRQGIYADLYELVAINDDGYAVGSKRRYGLAGSTAILTTPSFDETLYLPIGYAEATAINNRYQIVGATSLYTRRAFLYDYGMAGLTGEPVDLGTLADSLYSHAADINDAGVVVGGSSCESCAFAPEVDHAFVWKEGRMVDLNTLTSAAPDWVLTEAVAINERGDIVGTGLLDGEPHGFLLSRDGATVTAPTIASQCAM